MLDSNMAKLGGVVVSLFNAVVLGAVAFRSKAPKTWTLRANMPWLQTTVASWAPRQYPQTELVQKLLELDKTLLRTVLQMTPVPDATSLLISLKSPILQRVGRITDTREHLEYMDNVTKGFKNQDLDTRKFICAWFLVRGASCLQGFGETTSTQEMKRRVRLVLGRSFMEPNNVFDEEARTKTNQGTLHVPRDDPFYDLTNEVLYEGSDSWPRSVVRKALSIPAGPPVT